MGAGSSGERGLKWVISSYKIELLRKRSGVLFDTDAVDVHSQLQNYPLTLTESIIDVFDSIKMSLFVCMSNYGSITQKRLNCF